MDLVLVQRGMCADMTERVRIRGDWEGRNMRRRGRKEKRVGKAA